MPLFCTCAGDFDLTFPAKVPSLTSIIEFSNGNMWHDIVLTAVFSPFFLPCKDVL